MLWAIPISSFILKKWLFHLFPLFFSSSDAPAFSYYGQSDMHWVDNELVHHWLEQAQCTLEASFCNKMELGHRNTSIVHKQLLASQTHRHCESFSVSFEAFCSGSHEIWPLPSLYIYIIQKSFIQLTRQAHFICQLCISPVNQIVFLICIPFSIAFPPQVNWRLLKYKEGIKTVGCVELHTIKPERIARLKWYDFGKIAHLHNVRYLIIVRLIWQMYL